MKILFARLVAMFRRSRLDRDMDAEMGAHLEHEAARNIERGMSPEEARCAARRTFGGIDRLKEEERDARSVRWIENLARDVRHAVRQLARSPGFTAVAVLSLALGIGANTAIFSVINALLLRALPVPDAHQLRVVEWTGHNPRMSNMRGTAGGFGGSFPYPVFEDFRRRAADTAAVFAFFELPNLTVVDKADATKADGLMVSGDFFSGYGVGTMVGRPLTPEDDRPEAMPVAVVTHRWWERHMGSDPEALGTTIGINQHSFTIVGILAREYAGPTLGDAPDIYVPMSAQPQLHPGFALDSWNHWWVQIMVRLSPQADAARLHAAFVVGFQQALSVPGQSTTMEDPSIAILDGSRGPAGIRRFIALPLLGLLALVGLALTVACANLASLLVARSVARRHELAVRAALGASRWRLIQQTLTEAFVLSAIGGTLGLLASTWSRSSLLLPLLRIDDRFHLVLGTDGHVLGFTVIATALTALTAGLLPALRGSRVDPSRDLGSTHQSGGSTQRTGRMLVSVQMGLSAILVVVAGLFARSLTNLTTTELGFNTSNVLVFGLDAGQAGRSGAEALRFFENVRDRIAAIPGVRGVTMSDHALLSRMRAMNGISIPGHEPPPGVPMQASQLAVGDGFFRTMEIPLLLGRAFSETDNEATPPVVVVNEQFVRTFLDGAHPIGQTFDRTRNGPVEIVGVCANTKYTDMRTPIEPIMYLPLRQHPRGAVQFDVRTVLPPMALVPAVRQAVAALDPTMPLAPITTQEELYRQSIFLDHLISVLCGFLALLALGLTCIGLYGLMACHVARRTREIGVRIALGATPERVSREVLREGLVIAVRGLVVGLPVALILALAARAIFFGVPPYDPLTFVAATIVLPLVAAFAGWLPARRAARVDPMIALRAE